MDTWTLIVRIGGGIFLLLILIYGIDTLRKKFYLVSLRNRIFIILSFLLLPLMFGTCTAINQLSPDKTHDVFGFKRPAVEERKGFETKSMRRERGLGNIVEYFTSRHGLISILCTIVVGSLFILCIYKVVSKNLESESIDFKDFKDGYIAITVVAGILSLIVWSNS